MKTFPQDDFYGGFVGYDASSRRIQFDAFEAFADSKPLSPNHRYDEHAAIIHSHVINQDTKEWSIANFMTYTSPDVAQLTNNGRGIPKRFEPFTTQLASQGYEQQFSTGRISNITDFAQEIGNASPPGIRAIFATSTYKNSANMMERAFTIANESAWSLLGSTPGSNDGSEVIGLTFSLTFQPLSRALYTKNGNYTSTNESPPIFGLDPTRDGDLTNVLLTLMWTHASDDARVRRTVKDFFDRADAEAKTFGVWHPFLYLNYAADWQDPIRGYGEAVRGKMVEVANTYDQQAVFQKQCIGGFKLERKLSMEEKEAGTKH